MEDELEALKQSLKMRPGPPYQGSPTQSIHGQDVSELLNQINIAIGTLTATVKTLQNTISEVQLPVDFATNLANTVTLLKDIQSQQTSLNENVNSILTKLGYPK